MMWEMFMTGGAPNTITAGTPQVIESVGGTLASACVALSTSQVLVVYGNSSGIRAVVLDISGTTITVNTVKSITASTTGALTSVAYVSATQVVIGYGTNHAMVLDISGSTITTNTALNITNATNYISIIPYDSTHVIALYNGTAPNYIEARVLTIAASTLSENTAVAVSTTATASQTIGKLLSSTQALIGFVESTSVVKLMILDLSGTTITTNTAATLTNAVTIAAGAGGSMALGANNSTKATAVYVKSGEVGAATRVATVSGSSVSVGAETVIDASAVPPLSCNGLDSDNAIGLYATSGNAGEALIIGSATPVTAGTPTQYDAGPVQFSSICALSPTKAVAVYADGGNSYYITAVVLDIS